MQTVCTLKVCIIIVAKIRMRVQQVDSRNADVESTVQLDASSLSPHSQHQSVPAAPETLYTDTGAFNRSLLGIVNCTAWWLLTEGLTEGQQQQHMRHCHS